MAVTGPTRAFRRRSTVEDLTLIKQHYGVNGNKHFTGIEGRRSAHPFSTDVELCFSNAAVLGRGWYFKAHHHVHGCCDGIPGLISRSTTRLTGFRLCDRLAGDDDDTAMTVRPIGSVKWSLRRCLRNDKRTGGTWFSY